jgi:hypothetical protein
LDGIDATIQSLGFSLIYLESIIFFSMMANILSIPIEAPTDGTGVVENIPIRSSYLPLIKNNNI